MKIQDNIVDWLLEDSNPSVRYRTMTEIQDIKLSENEINKEKEKILKSSIA